MGLLLGSVVMLSKPSHTSMDGYLLGWDFRYVLASVQLNGLTTPWAESLVA